VTSDRRVSLLWRDATDEDVGDIEVEDVWVWGKAPLPGLGGGALVTLSRWWLFGRDFGDGGAG